MLTDKLSSTIVFPWVLFDRNGMEVGRGNGLLFGPQQGFDFDNAARHCQPEALGWSRCPSGYACYLQRIQVMGEHRLALVGLKVSGISSAVGKSGSLSIKTDTASIEGYVRGLSKAFRLIEKEYLDLISGSIHEIRHINTDIKIASEDLIYNLESREVDISFCRTRAMNSKALSEVLSARIDFLEVLSNPLIMREPRRPVVAYQKFDKIKKSLDARALDKSVRIYIDGISRGNINAMKVFDVIPYVLIQNAIKYSPRETEVRIFAKEDNKNIVFRIKNLGPRLESDEINSIFNYGVRGKNAILNGERGSGIGLYFVKALIGYHEGEISIEQSDSISVIRNIPFSEFTVTVSFPRVE